MSLINRLLHSFIPSIHTTKMIKTMLCITVLMLMQCNGCKIVLSELNLFDSFFGHETFIELSTRHCLHSEEHNIQLSKHGLILLRSKEKKEDEVEVIVTINLLKKTFPANGDFFIIASGPVGNKKREPDFLVNTNTAQIGWIPKPDKDTQKESKAMFSYFNVEPPKNPVHLLILIDLDHGDKRVVDKWNSIRLAKTSTSKNIIRESKPIVLTDDQLSFLKERMVDALFFSKEDRPVISLKFRNLFENDAAYVRQRIYTQQLEPLKTLNRCDMEFEQARRGKFLSESEPKQGTPTPGEPNDCAGEHLLICEAAEERGRHCGEVIDTAAELDIAVHDEDESEREYEELEMELAESLDIEDYTEARNINTQLDRIEGMLQILINKPSQCVEPPAKKKRLEICDRRAYPEHIQKMLAEVDKEKRPWEMSFWTPQFESRLKESNKAIFDKFDFIKNHKWIEPVVKPSGRIGLRCRMCYEEKKFRYMSAHPKVIQINSADIDEWEKASTSSFAMSEGYDPESWQKLKHRLSEHIVGRAKGKAKGVGRKDEAKKHPTKHYYILMQNKNNFLREKERKTQRIIQSVEDDPTGRMLRLVYLQTKLNYPLYNHETLVGFVDKFGVDLGSHRRNRITATEMLETFSTVMHRKLLAFLKSSSTPISIILDTSTDTSGNNYLVVQFRCIVEDYPVVYLYRLIKLERETSQAMVEKMTKAFEDDSIKELMENRLIGMGSDGASVMRAEGGVYGRLKKFVRHGKPFVAVHCFAHRLQLAFANGIRTIPDVEEIENHIHDIIGFFSNKGVKRRNALIEVSIMRNVKFIELKPLFRVRWSESETESVASIIRNYQMLHELFQSVQSDKDNFTYEVRQQAAFYFRSFSHIGFFSFLGFFSDVLNTLTKNSKKYQLEGGVLIGQNIRTKNLIDELSSLKENDGPVLRKILNSLSCKKGVDPAIIKPCPRENVWAERGPRTIVVTRMFMQYPENDYVADFAADINGDIFQETVIAENLRPQRRTAPATLFSGPSNNIEFPVFGQAMRNKIVDGLIREIKGYFPEDKTEEMEMLMPDELPEDHFETNEYAGKIRPLAESFLFDPDAVDAQFKDLLDSFLGDRKYFQAKKLSPQVFWSWAMKNEKHTVGAELQKLLHHILALPIGSADAERAFSILFHIRSKRRSRLTPKHLEDNLRVRMNGPPVGGSTWSALNNNKVVPAAVMDVDLRRLNNHRNPISSPTTTTQDPHHHRPQQTLMNKYFNDSLPFFPEKCS